MNENITKIKYLQVTDKVYKVMDIDFSNLTIKATECDTDIKNIPEEQLFHISDFKDFHITLRNSCNNIVEIDEWKKQHAH